MATAKDMPGMVPPFLHRKAGRLHPSCTRVYCSKYGFFGMSVNRSNFLGEDLHSQVHHEAGEEEGEKAGHKSLHRESSLSSSNSE